MIDDKFFIYFSLSHFYFRKITFVQFVENHQLTFQRDLIHIRVDLHTVNMNDRIKIEVLKIELQTVVCLEEITDGRKILINRDNCEKFDSLYKDDDGHNPDEPKLCVHVCLLLFIMKFVRNQDRQPRNIFSLVTMRFHCLTHRAVFSFFFFLAFCCIHTFTNVFSFS